MRVILLGAALALIAAPSFADPMTDLAKSKQCFSCHDVSGQLLAQSFETIAKKYHGVKNADAYLAGIIQKGGIEHFGPDLMPSAGARVKVSDADAKALASWILTMK
jgi:cytochrome c